MVIGWITWSSSLPTPYGLINGVPFNRTFKEKCLPLTLPRSLRGDFPRPGCAAHVVLEVSARRLTLADPSRVDPEALRQSSLGRLGADSRSVQTFGDGISWNGRAGTPARASREQQTQAAGHEARGAAS